MILQNFLRWKTLSIMSYRPCDANRIGFRPLMAKVSSLYLLNSYCNLNCIKDLSVTLNFARPAGKHKCIKEHLECPNKSGNQDTQLKFYILIFICDHIQSHIFKTCSIDSSSRDFLTQTAQGRRHIR